MKILLLGSGGREHALAWKIAQSPLCDKLWIAPGNPGTMHCGENVAMQVNDFSAIGKFCETHGVEMLVPGPEIPLIEGIADYFQKEPALQKIAVTGPLQKGAMLEGSKAFAKQFMQKYGIPSAAYREFTAAQRAEAHAYIRAHTLPVVLKADGPAAGKGVLICNSREEAERELDAMLDGRFGASGERVVIEEFLQGKEFTVMVLTDGKNANLLPPSRDYKKIGEGDTGPNTGGMGAISPVPGLTPEKLARIENSIIQPTLTGLGKEGIPYKGFLYFGLIESAGQFYVIEYNCRAGDPETEVVLPRLDEDLVSLFQSIANGTLERRALKITPESCATVILASEGYPGAFEKGKAVSGIENTSDCLVFQAGTADGGNGGILTAGGRVMAVSALGSDLEDALRTCYANVGRIYFETRYFRSDIGWDA